MSDVAEETYLGYTSTSSPLLLWLTVNADWHSGDKHEFAAFLKHFHADGDDTDLAVAVLYVLGDDGPKEARFIVSPGEWAPVILTVICAAYDVNVTKEIQNWV
jgi:hypothetical protein